MRQQFERQGMKVRKAPCQESWRHEPPHFWIKTLNMTPKTGQPALCALSVAKGVRHMRRSLQSAVYTSCHVTKVTAIETFRRRGHGSSSSAAVSVCVSGGLEQSPSEMLIIAAPAWQLGLLSAPPPITALAGLRHNFPVIHHSPGSTREACSLSAAGCLGCRSRRRRRITCGTATPSRPARPSCTVSQWRYSTTSTSASTMTPAGATSRCAPGGLLLPVGILEIGPPGFRIVSIKDSFSLRSCTRSTIISPDARPVLHAGSMRLCTAWRAHCPCRSTAMVFAQDVVSDVLHGDLA